MTQQFTASEARELAKHMESVGWRPDSNGDPDCCDEGAARSAEMLFAFADMLEAQEKAVPVAWWNKRTGQILRPHELDAIPDAPHPHSYFKKGFVPLAAHSAQAQPPAASVPGVSAQAHENAQAALAAQENPNG